MKAPEGTTIVEPGFAVSPQELTTHNGKPYLIQTCYTLEGGKWEGFVSMESVSGLRACNACGQHHALGADGRCSACYKAGR